MTITPIETHRRFLDKSIKILRYCGVMTFDSTASMYQKFYNNTLRIFNYVIVVFYFITLITDVIINYKDLMTIADDGCFIAGWIVTYFKIHKFYTQRHKICKLIDDVHNPVDVLRQSCDLGVLTTMKTYMFFDALDFFLFSNCAVTLGIALVILVPREKGKLPVHAVFPFDIKKSPNYELALFIQLYTLIFGLISIAMEEFISLGFLRWTTLQLKVLSANYKNCNSHLIECADFNLTQDTYDCIKKFKISNILDDQIEISKFVEFDRREDKKKIEKVVDCFKWRFKTCVKHHQRITHIIDDLNDVFDSCLIVQFAVSLFLICLNGFLIVMCADDRKKLISALTYLSVGFLQLLYWCGFGNELSFQANSLTASQMMSGWENWFEIGLKNLVTTAMIKTMQPLEMRAGGIFVLSLDTFINVSEKILTLK
nr:olfactory receptor 115 [Microplitis mediator]